MQPLQKATETAEKAPLISSSTIRSDFRKKGKTGAPAPQRVVGLNQTMKYMTVGHLEHKRRMKCNAAYAQFMVGGSASSTDLTAQLVALVFSTIAGAATLWMASAAPTKMSPSRLAALRSTLEGMRSALDPPKVKPINAQEDATIAIQKCARGRMVRTKERDPNS